MSGRSLLGGTVVFGGAVEVVPGDPGSVEHRAYRNFCGALGLSYLRSEWRPRPVLVWRLFL